MAAHDPWFKQFAATREDPRLVLMARALGVRHAEVIGCITALKCWALRGAADGVFDELAAASLEVHAKWEGEPGAFAATAVDVGVLTLSRDTLALNTRDWLDKEVGSLKEAQRKAAIRVRKAKEAGLSPDCPGTEAPEPPPGVGDVPGQTQDRPEAVPGPESRDERVEKKDTPPLTANAVATTPATPSPQALAPTGGSGLATKKQFDEELSNTITTQIGAPGYKAWRRVCPTVDELRAAADELRADIAAKGLSVLEGIGCRGAFVIGIVERKRRDAQLAGPTKRPPQRTRGYLQPSEKHEVGDALLGR